jgi:hypothetical protein
LREVTKGKHLWTKDARGRLVTQLDPIAMRLLVQHETIPAEVLRDIAEEIDPGEVRKRRLGLVGGLIGAGVAYVLIFFYFQLFGKGSGRDPVMITFYIAYLVAPPVVVYWKFRKARKARHERVRRVMLKHLRCPHCGYDIRGLPTAREDGATVCPECGCAWKLDDHRGTASAVPQTCHPRPVEENRDV